MALAVSPSAGGGGGGGGGGSTGGSRVSKCTERNPPAGASFDNASTNGIVEMMRKGGTGTAGGDCATTGVEATTDTGLVGNVLDDDEAAVVAVGDGAGLDAGMGSLGKEAAGGNADRSGCMGMPRSVHDRKLPVTKGTASENEASGRR